MASHSDSVVTPDPAPERVGGNWHGSGTLVTIIPGSLKPDSGNPETETGNLETEKELDPSIK